MPWIVGIDEAGYGPNLGPLVMTAVACRITQDHITADLWDVFQSLARRHTEPADARMVVADSKRVYSPSRGLADLEQTVHAMLQWQAGSTVSDFVDRLCPDCRDDLHGEIWYAGNTVLPLVAEAEPCSRGGQMLLDQCASLGFEWGPIRSVVVCPTAFNALVDRWGSKGAVLALSMVRLLRGLPRNGEPVVALIDKHGGRNSYAALLQPAFDDGLVMAQSEGSQSSTYRLVGGGREVEVTFQPRADANNFCVALASMVSKYLREVLMLDFNRFWQAKVPGLKPTAGYPSDSRRFWADIRGAVRRMGIEKDRLWRRR